MGEGDRYDYDIDCFRCHFLTINFSHGGKDSEFMSVFMVGKDVPVDLFDKAFSRIVKCATFRKFIHMFLFLNVVNYVILYCVKIDHQKKTSTF